MYQGAAGSQCFSFSQEKKILEGSSLWGKRDGLVLTSLSSLLRLLSPAQRTVPILPPPEPPGAPQQREPPPQPAGSAQHLRYPERSETEQGGAVAWQGGSGRVTSWDSSGDPLQDSRYLPCYFCLFLGRGPSMEPRALQVLGKGSTTELQPLPQSLYQYFLFFY